MTETQAPEAMKNGKHHRTAVRKPAGRSTRRMTVGQKQYLMRGLAEPGGKLPLFDLNGQRISRQTIESCLNNGWCEPWTKNPILPSWLVCRLTSKGKAALKKFDH